MDFEPRQRRFGGWATGRHAVKRWKRAAEAGYGRGNTIRELAS